MNDIEILEDYLKFIKQFDNNSAFIPALENLIQENKELKEQQLRKAGIYKIDIDFDSDYIPKSKIKEIIYPTPENPIPFEVQSSKMYKKLEKLEEGE